MRIGNQSKTSGWNTLIFRPGCINLLVSVGQTTPQRIDYFYVNEAIPMSEHRTPTYLFHLAMVYLYSVLCIAHILTF